MNRILFFISAGRVREFDRSAASAINEATGKPVVFRNGTMGDGAMEDCAGVAGKCIPAQYASKPHYSLTGELVDTPAPEAPEASTDGDSAKETPSGNLNALGLPEGHPPTRDAIKEALENAGVEFHPNAKTEKLVDLYRTTFNAAYPDRAI